MFTAGAGSRGFQESWSRGANVEKSSALPTLLCRVICNNTVEGVPFPSPSLPHTDIFKKLRVFVCLMCRDVKVPMICTFVLLFSIHLYLEESM